MRRNIATVVVQPVSPGRLRLRLPALYRQDANRQRLEHAVLKIGYVAAARGNPLTGSLLILFDPRQADIQRLLRDLESIVGPIPAPAAERPAQAPASRDTTRHRRPPATRRPGRRHSHGADRIPAAPPAMAVTERRPWHAESAAAALSHWHSAETGLADAEARQRLAVYGPNRLDDHTRRSTLKMLAGQFLNIPVAMLGVSAAVSIATGGFADAVVIGGVVLLNALIGYLTESSAEKTINALGNLLPSHALTVRDGQRVEVPLEAVVPGDVLVLTPGAYIPADARLLAASHLTLDESALTGESHPVAKTATTLCAAETPLGERVNMVHMGTVVTGGSGLAVVTASGKASEIGAIQTLVGEVAPPETPLQRQLDRMGVQLAAFSAGICVLVFAIGVLRGQGWLAMLNSAVSLAVAAVPEGLPAVATTTLALGIREMQRRKVLIRQLPAVESLGSVQVLCLDKTGTLTLNQMKVVTLQTERLQLSLAEGRYLDAEGQAVAVAGHADVRQLLEVVALCSEVVIAPGADRPLLDGSPTECALVEAALQGGIDVPALRRRRPLGALQHRAEQRPYMLSRHPDASGGDWVAVKGSPAEVLALCREWQCGGERRPLTRRLRQAILARNEDLAGEALRVLGVAHGHGGSGTAETPDGLVWLGLIGMEDIIRPGTPALMAQFHAAGIETVMITGDQSATAYSVGRRLGLNHRRPLEILDAVRLDSLEPELLAGIVEDTTIFARVSPAHKLRIVQALQKGGRVIAMTGDGINDGPALKAADVGVAMGRQGAEVARSVADVVLQDDNLETMITAVEQGRTIYSNIRKSLRFLLSTNLSEIELMLATTTLGFGEALNPMQLLWINLVTDVFPALALALEPPERDVLKQPPRDPRQPIISRADSLRLLRESAAITASGLGVFGLSLTRYGMGPQASTNLFMTLTLAQFLHSISCRSETTTVLDHRRPGNPYLSLAIGGSLAVQVLAVFLPPLRRLLRLSPLGPADWLLILAGSAAPFLINEAAKGLRPARTPETP